MHTALSLLVANIVYFTTLLVQKYLINRYVQAEEVVAAVVTPFKTSSSMITSEVKNCIAFDEAATTIVEPSCPSKEKLEKLNDALINLGRCRGRELKDHFKQICAEHLATYGSLIALQRHDQLIKQGLLNYFMIPGDIFEAKRKKYGKGRDGTGRDKIWKIVTRKAYDLYLRIIKSIAKDQGISIQKSSALTSSSNVSSQREQQQTADRFEFSGGNNSSQSPVQSNFLEKEHIDETIDESDDKEGSDTDDAECVDSVDMDSDEDSSDSQGDNDDEGHDKDDRKSVNSGVGVDRDADIDDKGQDDNVDSDGCGAGIKEGVDNDGSSEKGDGIDSNENVDGNNIDRDGISIKGDSVDKDCGDDDEEGVDVDSDEDDEEGDEDEGSDEDFEEEDSGRKNKTAVTESDESNQEGPATRSAIKRRSSSGVVEMQYSLTDRMASDTVAKRPLFTLFKRNSDSDDEAMSPVVGSQSDSTSNRHKSKKTSCFGYIVFIKDQLSNWVKIGVGSGSRAKCSSRYATAYPGTVTFIW